MVTVSGSLEPAGPSGLIAVLAHQASNAALANPHPNAVNSSVMRGRPEPPKAQAKLVATMGQAHPVALLAVRRKPVFPRMGPALRHARQVAQMAAGQAPTAIGTIPKRHGIGPSFEPVAPRASIGRDERHRLFQHRPPVAGKTGPLTVCGSGSNPKYSVVFEQPSAPKQFGILRGHLGLPRTHPDPLADG